MAVVTFRRPPRLAAPVVPADDITIAPPPTRAARRFDRPSLWLLLPVLIAVLAAAILLLATQDRSPLQLTAAILFAGSAVVLIGAVGWALIGTGGRTADRRAAYYRHLADVRRRARTAADAQRAGQLWSHPEPTALISLVRTSRLWERRPADPDFAVVRIGVGGQPLAATLQPAPPGGAEPDTDVVAAEALRRLLRVHRTVPALPVLLPLRSVGRVRLEGDATACRRMAAAMVVQAACWHAPSEFRIALCVDEDGLAGWDWLKWVPHLADPAVPPTDLPRFIVAGDLGGIEAQLADELAERPWSAANGTGPDAVSRGGHILVIVDGGGPGGRRLADADGVQGVTVLDVRCALDAPPTPRLLRLRVTADDVLAVRTDDNGRETVAHLGSPDLLGPAEAAATARGLAAIRLLTDGADHPLWSPTSLAEVIGVANPRALNTSVLWRPRPDRDRLRVAVGVEETGQAVEIDIKEPARGGMGPHGLVVGAAGSGRSELLRTIVLGLAITHPSDELNFLLVDVPGRGAFAALEGLPHTSAVVDDLTGDPGLVDRLAVALAGELDRRRELLPVGAGDPPALPELLIVIDDGGQLLAAHPELGRLLAEICRSGGPLGLHLLLAVGEAAAASLAGLDTLLSYRIALRMTSIEGSRLIIGTGDAAHLPPRPGVGYLSAGQDRLVRFTAASVSCPVRPPTGTAGPHGWVDPQMFRLAVAAPPALPAGAEPARSSADRADRADRALIDVAVAQLTGSGVPAHEIWLPPLAASPTLDLLLPRVSVQASGVAAADPPTGSAFLRVPLGWVDRPFEQSRDLLTLELSGRAGPIAVVGAPGSGKSTALRSLICAVALTHSPSQVQLYCLDFGRGDLHSLQRLPQLGGVADRGSPERVRRTVRMLSGILADRVRAGAVSGRRGADEPAQLILVVDGWDGLVADFPLLEGALVAVAARGWQHGITTVLTARALPASGVLDDLIGTRLELRLDDPAQSRIDPELAARVPTERPGRGLTADRLQLLTALPRIDGHSGVDGLARATDDLVRIVEDRWPGQGAPAVPVLPAVVGPTDLPADLDPALGFPIGLDTDLAPVLFNPRTDHHLMIFGGPRSGKTTVLRRLMAQISARHGTDEARFIVLDSRRHFDDAAQHPGQIIATATTPQEAVATVEAAVTRLRARLPAPSMTWEDIAGRHWWGSTADIYLVIDDDALLTAAAVPGLVSLLARAPDIALHLLISRHAQGAARAMSDPLLAGLAEVDTPALVLSGPATEGTIYGRTPVLQRPPGRGIWVPRRGPEVLMQAVLDPQEW